MAGYDLHVHTEASFDCRTALDELVQCVRRQGLSGIGVTDHDTIESALRLRDHQLPFDVVPGCEVTLGTGAHVIGLFLYERPMPGASLEETTAAIRDQGGMVILPHPFRPVTGVLAIEEAESRWREILDLIDMIEVFNAKSTWHENVRAMALARDLGFAASAGSDAHLSREIGNARLFPQGDRAFSALRTSAVRQTAVRGIDQTHAAVNTVRRRRERRRRTALKLKPAVPSVVWRWAKARWEDSYNSRDPGVGYPMRDYGLFGDENWEAEAGDCVSTVPAS